MIFIKCFSAVLDCAYNRFVWIRGFCLQTISVLLCHLQNSNINLRKVSNHFEINIGKFARCFVPKQTPISSTLDSTYGLFLKAWFKKLFCGLV